MIWHKTGWAYDDKKLTTAVESTAVDRIRDALELEPRVFSEMVRTIDETHVLVNQGQCNEHAEVKDAISRFLTGYVPRNGDKPIVLTIIDLDLGEKVWSEVHRYGSTRSNDESRVS
jgi:hypothetical protein